jgi:hypothetical protein
MMTIRTHGLAALLVVTAAASLDADRIRLRSGTTVEGMFIGGDSKTVRILLDDGSVSEVRLEDATAIEFSARKPKAPPTAKAAPPVAKAAPATPTGRATLMVPTGTLVNVRLSQTIEVDASQAGQRYRAIVDDPVMVNGSIAIPRGAAAMLQAVKVDQSGSMKGSDKITLKLNAISIGGMVYEVTSTYVESKGKGEGKRTARKVGGGAGLGAIVGGIAGGGEGAAIGAAIGGITGAAVASGGEEHLKLEAETRIAFQLAAAVAVKQ